MNPRFIWGPRTMRSGASRTRLRTALGTALARTPDPGPDSCYSVLRSRHKKCQGREKRQELFFLESLGAGIAAAAKIDGQINLVAVHFARIGGLKFIAAN